MSLNELGKQKLYMIYTVSWWTPLLSILCHLILSNYNTIFSFS